MALGFNEPLGKFFGRKLAALLERFAAFGGQAFDATLDRDAAGAAKEVEHVGLPQVDAGLDAEFQPAPDETLEQGGIREEDLIDEIDIFDALALEMRDFGDDGIGRTLAVSVAEILLGAKSAAIRAAARSLDLGSGPAVQFATSGIGLLVFILYLPGGLAGVVTALGDAVAAFLATPTEEALPAAPDNVEVVTP